MCNVRMTSEHVYVIFDKAKRGVQQKDRVCVVAKILLPSTVAMLVCVRVCVGSIIT